MATILSRQNHHHVLTGILDSIPSPPPNKGLASSVTSQESLKKKGLASSVTTQESLSESTFASKINEADISGATALISSLIDKDSSDDFVVSNPPISRAARHETTTAVPEVSKKVIIVGAGISGLRAAAILLRHGVEVLILEGREDRIGGRICTSRKVPNRLRDIGAAWMHETSQNKLVKLIPKLGIDYYYDDGAALYFTAYGRAGSQFKAKKVADEWADFCSFYYEENPNAPDQSVMSGIKNFLSEHALITEDERQWAPQTCREVELWIGTSIELASAKHLSYYATERNLYMKGGYDKLVNWTARSFADNPDIIRLGQTVKQINSDDTKTHMSVLSTSRDGCSFSFEADAVVCTAPLGVLRNRMISFNSLPTDLEESFHKFSYGALGKVFVEFSDVFWPKDNDQFIYYPSPTDEPVNENSILAYATVTSNLWIMGGTRELCIQIAEPLTQKVEAMTDDTELYEFFRPLFNLMRTEPHKALPKLLNIETTHWTQDPLAGFGSYSVEKVGDDPEALINALKKYKGERLQFAGEHCVTVGNGCVHGAFASGETAAKNLLTTLGLTFDGIDDTL